MYRRNRHSSGCLPLIIVLGIVAGVVYFVHDQAAQPVLPPLLSAALLTQEPESPTTPLPSEPIVIPTTISEPSAEPVKLIIPEANIGADIVHVFLDTSGQWNVSHLGANAGVLQGTAWIGEPGNIVMVGHIEMSDGSPGIFANLDHLEIGDEILLVESGSTRWSYYVNNIRSTEPDDLSVLYPSAQNMLTLITCDNYDFVSNTYLTRTIVTATSTDLYSR